MLKGFKTNKRIIRYKSSVDFIFENIGLHILSKPILNRIFTML